MGKVRGQGLSFFFSLGGRIDLGRMHSGGVAQTFPNVPVQPAREGEPRHRQTRLVREFEFLPGEDLGGADGRADGRIRLAPGRDASRPTLSPPRSPGATTRYSRIIVRYEPRRGFISGVVSSVS